MKIGILEKNDVNMKFLLSDADIGMANAIRRILRSGVPVMSIEDVNIEANNSGLFDEVIAHRMGLIPMTFDMKLFRVRKEGEEPNSRTQVAFALEKEGPAIVKAGDLKSTDDSVKPVDAEIPITELLQGQRLKLDATAELGLGTDHVKFQAAIAGYQNIWESKAGTCEKHTLEKKGSKARIAIEDGCEKCAKLLESGELAADENSFVFKVETVSGLTPEQLLTKALEIIESQAEEFVKEAKKAVK